MMVSNVGTFGSRTSAGSQVITGVGFVPKAIVFFASGAAHSSINTATTNGTLGMGFVSAVGEMVSFCAGSLTGQATGSGLSRGQTDSCVLWSVAGSGGTVIRAELTSFDADGFTLNYINANATSRSVSYIALGGDIDVKAGVVQVPTVGGAVAATGVGFEPDLVLLIHHGMCTTGADRSGFFFGFGAASSPSARAACFAAEASGTVDSNTARIQLSDCAVVSHDPDGVVNMKCDLASFDGSGFTLSIATNPTSAADVGFLALGRVSAKVGVDTQPLSATTKTTTGLPHTPIGLLLGSVSATASASAAGGVANSLGASDGTNDGCQWSRGADNSANTAEGKVHSNAKAIQAGDPTANTILAEAAVSAFASGEFTLDWTTADATAREFFYVSMAEQPVVVTPQVLAMQTHIMGHGFW